MSKKKCSAVAWSLTWAAVHTSSWLGLHQPMRRSRQTYASVWWEFSSIHLVSLHQILKNNLQCVILQQGNLDMLKFILFQLKTICWEKSDCKMLYLHVTWIFIFSSSGNGDILSHEDLDRHLKNTQVTGYMVARYKLCHLFFGEGGSKHLSIKTRL